MIRVSCLPAEASGLSQSTMVMTLPHLRDDPRCACYVPLVDGPLAAVASSVVIATVIGVLAWLFAPFRNKLETLRMRLTSDHGLKLEVLSRPDDLKELVPEDMLGVSPDWLFGPSYYFSPAPPPEAPPDALDEWLEWAKRNGGEDVLHTHVMLRLQATKDRTVVMGAPKPVVTHTTVTSGAICSPAGLGGNGLLVRRFIVDLDDAHPRARFVDGVEERESAQFRMSKGDSEAVLLYAHSTIGRSEWWIEIPFLVDGVKVTLKADDHGRPFVTVGPQRVRRLMWADATKTGLNCLPRRHWNTADSMVRSESAGGFRPAPTYARAHEPRASPHHFGAGRCPAGVSVLPENPQLSRAADRRPNDSAPESGSAG